MKKATSSQVPDVLVAAGHPVSPSTSRPTAKLRGPVVASGIPSCRRTVEFLPSAPTTTRAFTTLSLRPCSKVTAGCGPAVIHTRPEPQRTSAPRATAASISSAGARVAEVQHPGGAGHHRSGVHRRRFSRMWGHRVPVGDDTWSHRPLRSDGDVQQTGPRQLGIAPREHGLAADSVAELRRPFQDGHGRAGTGQPHSQGTAGDASADDRDVGRRLVHRQRLDPGGSDSGVMFWFRRKTLAGSYRRFTCASLGALRPYAERTRSGPSAPRLLTYTASCRCGVIASKRVRVQAMLRSESSESSHWERIRRSY